MTALPTWMTDRWQHRADPAPGEGTVYWHMPMHDHPQVTRMAPDSALSLIIQRGPERLWDWTTVATVPFAATAVTRP
jgi:hypothetical protein